MRELPSVTPEKYTSLRPRIANRFLQTGIRLACVALLMVGCSRPVAEGQPNLVALDLKSAIPSEVSNLIQNSNLKPVSGAGGATVAIFAGYPDEHEFIGQGFIVDKKGKLSIYTVTHVVVGEVGYVNIPGLGLSGELNPYHFFYGRGAHFFSTRDQSGLRTIDRAVEAPLDEYSSSSLSALMREKGIQPLTIAEIPIEDSEQVAIPSLTSGKDTILKRRSLFGFRNGYEVVKGNPICGGQSGSPLRRMIGDQTTTEVVAVLSSIRLGNGKSCSFLAYGIPLR